MCTTHTNTYPYTALAAMHTKQGEGKVELVIVAADNWFSFVLFRLVSFGFG